MSCHLVLQCSAVTGLVPSMKLSQSLPLSPSYVRFEGLVTGSVIICVCSVSICPAHVDAIKKREIHQTYYIQNFEVYS